jgi:hypothetical protein
VATWLKDDFARVRQTDRASVCRIFLGAPELVPESEVLLVGLRRRLVEEQGGQGCDQKAEKLENSSEEMADTSALACRARSGGSWRCGAPVSTHSGQKLMYFVRTLKFLPDVGEQVCLHLDIGASTKNEEPWN